MERAKKSVEGRTRACKGVLTQEPTQQLQIQTLGEFPWEEGAAGRILGWLMSSELLSHWSGVVKPCRLLPREKPGHMPKSDSWGHIEGSGWLILTNGL